MRKKGRWELLWAIYKRYRKARKREKQVIWEAAGYPWSVRLLPLWMPWIRKHYRVRPEID